MFKILRNTCFYAALIPVTIIYSFLAIASAPLLPRHRYWVITRWSHIFIFLAKYLGGLDYQITNLPKLSQPVILVSNHQSMWETIYMQTVFPRQSIILKKELLNIPFFGWGLALIDPIALNRREFSSVKRLLQLGIKHLSQGKCILVYPEGTRMPYGEIGRFSRSAAALSKASGYPILPISHNSGKFWPKGPFIAQSGLINIHCGALIYPTNQNLTELNLLIENAVKTNIC